MSEKKSSDEERCLRANVRYEAALHAMQSGVKFKMERDGYPPLFRELTGEASPKHLRVGVNSAFVTGKAVADLLIKKGLITEAEYFEAQADAMEEEVAMYQGFVDSIFGEGKVKLE